MKMENAETCSCGKSEQDSYYSDTSRVHWSDYIVKQIVKGKSIKKLWRSVLKSYHGGVIKQDEGHTICCRIEHRTHFLELVDLFCGCFSLENKLTTEKQKITFRNLEPEINDWKNLPKLSDNRSWQKRIERELKRPYYSIGEKLAIIEEISTRCHYFVQTQTKLPIELLERNKRSGFLMENLEKIIMEYLPVLLLFEDGFEKDKYNLKGDEIGILCWKLRSKKYSGISILIEKQKIYEMIDEVIEK